MSPKRGELALRKQHLQMRSAVLRDTFSACATGCSPIFSVADRIRGGWLWLRRHPALPVAVLVALLVARPRTLLRWIKRGFFAWQALHKLGSLIAFKPPRA